MGDYAVYLAVQFLTTQDALNYKAAQAEPGEKWRDYWDGRSQRHALHFISLNLTRTEAWNRRSRMWEGVVLGPDNLPDTEPEPEPDPEPEPEPGPYPLVPESLHPPTRQGLLFDESWGGAMGLILRYAEQKNDRITLVVDALDAQMQRSRYRLVSEDNGATWGQKPFVGPVGSMTRHPDGGWLHAVNEGVDSNHNRYGIYRRDSWTQEPTLVGSLGPSERAYMGDSMALMPWDDAVGQWIGFAKTSSHHPREFVRVVGSRDGSTWTPDMVDLDHRLTPNFATDSNDPDGMDVYGLHEFVTVGDWIYCIFQAHQPAYYNGGYESAAGMPLEDHEGRDNTIHYQLARSDDSGVTWHRLLGWNTETGRTPWLDIGADGAWDGKQLTGLSPVTIGGVEYWLYTGCPVPHVVGDLAQVPGKIFRIGVAGPQPWPWPTP